MLVAAADKTIKQSKFFFDSFLRTSAVISWSTPYSKGMFHVPEDPSVPELKHLDWFSPPFGASERVKKLDDWSAGRLPGITPKLLSPEWIVCHAE